MSEYILTETDLLSSVVNRGYTKEQFDRAIAKIKADALREVAAGFIDWDVIYGNAVATPEIEQSHRAATYIEREADKIEESVK